MFDNAGYNHDAAFSCRSSLQCTKTDDDALQFVILQQDFPQFRDAKRSMVNHPSEIDHLRFDEDLRQERTYGHRRTTDEASTVETEPRT